MKPTIIANLAAVVLAGLLAEHSAFGNGGPFVVKYPGGDPAAKGVFARLDPSLKPGKETRLRVVKEDLGVTFGSRASMRDQPLAEVSAVYTIENPTREEIKADFGFPILRGIYLIGGMSNTVKVEITSDKEKVKPILISNSVLYGMIRQAARDVLENGILRDQGLSGVVTPVRGAWVVTLTGPPEPESPWGRSLFDLPGPKPEPKPTLERRPTAAWLPARERLCDHLTTKLGWNPRNAALWRNTRALSFRLIIPGERGTRQVGLAALDRPRSRRVQDIESWSVGGDRRAEGYATVRRTLRRDLIARPGALTRRFSQPGAVTCESGPLTWQPARCDHAR